MLSDLQILLDLALVLSFIFLVFMIAVGAAILNINSLFKRLLDLLEFKFKEDNGSSDTIGS